MPEHCCEELDLAISRSLRGADVIMYDPVIRMYGYYIDRDLPIIQSIGFCPFCGAPLPEELSLDYFATIEAELGGEAVPPGWDPASTKHLPQEFQTEEWWRKRGL